MRSSAHLHLRLRHTTFGVCFLARGQTSHQNGLGATTRGHAGTVWRGMEQSEDLDTMSQNISRVGRTNLPLLRFQLPFYEHQGTRLDESDWQR